MNDARIYVLICNLYDENGPRSPQDLAADV